MALAERRIGPAKPPPRTPVINAPLPLTAFALLLLAIALIELVLPAGLFRTFRLLPADFSGAAAPPLLAVLTLATHGLLHGGLIHAVINGALFIGIGKPVFENLGYLVKPGSGRVTALFFVFFFACVVAGGLVYLVASGADPRPLVGASGGVSGLLAAVLMIFQPKPGRLLSVHFLRASAAFIVINFIMALIGPSLLGALIAWQPHLGGYVAGALLFRAMLGRKVA